jgi:hypothetical protein
MALTIFATRSSAAKLVKKDYRTVGKQTPDAELLLSNGKMVKLYLVHPVTQNLVNTESK